MSNKEFPMSKLGAALKQLVLEIDKDNYKYRSSAYLDIGNSVLDIGH